ncbi:hypothetical protein B0T21DRAFT_344163 [Apiosordaria backusii]|uniref:Uncharacterized protein n=1 Tax=Apiosordaria backusii TaxID=314023 RepID=A0AA40K760_9PEZI|nr:hypothetical protein B0T21DRAFT_344163 [Apiosordaria backusii]
MSPGISLCSYEREIHLDQERERHCAITRLFSTGRMEKLRGITLPAHLQYPFIDSAIVDSRCYIRLRTTFTTFTTFTTKPSDTRFVRKGPKRDQALSVKVRSRLLPYLSPDRPWNNETGTGVALRAAAAMLPTHSSVAAVKSFTVSQCLFGMCIQVPIAGNAQRCGDLRRSLQTFQTLLEGTEAAAYDSVQVQFGKDSQMCITRFFRVVVFNVRYRRVRYLLMPRTSTDKI